MHYPAVTADPMAKRAHLGGENIMYNITINVGENSTAAIFHCSAIFKIRGIATYRSIYSTFEARAHCDLYLLY